MCRWFCEPAACTELIHPAYFGPDDASPPVAPHVRDDGLGAQERTFERDAEVGVPDLLGHVLDGATGGRSGVVAENVDAAELVDGSLHHVDDI